MAERYVSKSLLLEKIDGILALIWEKLDDEHKKEVIKDKRRRGEKLLNYELRYDIREET